MPEGPASESFVLLAPAASGAAPTVLLPGEALAARRIARQVAEQTILRTGGRAEMSLAPEELGHLRLRVDVDEGGLRVLIEAARTDTADLLRRHVETLRQELRSEGLGSVSVSIGGGEANRGGGDAQGRAPALERAGHAPSPVTFDPGGPANPVPSRPRAGTGQLDLRF
ncbi:flagellar hook-length control protein FliK [Rubellimicrobium roseum]|uniref:flagellar hook-length control protein FliK n=1 Tax=Rubellimicrobium roseum TaxID=687525 RepID=UPI00159B9DCE|nr:flagellar hook-length control protein FliK [Rubellimicrobium roseum]